MCARFSLRTPAAVLAQSFDVLFDEFLQPRSNISPTDRIVVVRCQDAKREVVSMRWSLLPSWAKSPDAKPQPINATAEKIDSSGMFRTSFRRRRCLIPVDGWYEWKTINSKVKERYFFRLVDQPCFAMAGIWDRWESPDQQLVIESCALITTEANDLVATVHEQRRMPVIITPDAYATWLDHSIQDSQAVLPLLRTYPDAGMELLPVPRMLSDDWFDVRCWPFASANHSGVNVTLKLDSAGTAKPAAAPMPVPLRKPRSLFDN